MASPVRPYKRSLQGCTRPFKEGYEEAWRDYSFLRDAPTLKQECSKGKNSLKVLTRGPTINGGEQTLQHRKGQIAALYDLYLWAEAMEMDKEGLRRRLVLPRPATVSLSIQLWVWRERFPGEEPS